MKTLKQRTVDDTMRALKNAKLDSFGMVMERGWARVRDLSNRRNTVTLDWRIQRHNDDARTQQLCEITIGNNTAVVARQELEKYLRHV